MKSFNIKKVLFIGLFLISSIQINAQDLAYNDNIVNVFENNCQFIENQTVYICNGPYAYAYHSRSNCPGLNNCSGQVLVWDEVSALNSRWDKPCCRCWSNVYNNCKDDNPALGYSSGSGGGGNADIAAGVAIVVVFGSAIILSNDIYAYKVNSFYKNKNNQENSREGSGWVFGFRKTFDKSALEYGISIVERKSNYVNSSSKSYGAHLNYIHQIFDSKMPKNFNLYIGPSINSINELGYGGIIGAYYKIFDRLKLDIRYEFTTQTNQIQIGLIFKYQKKYFWK
jgi:hypothetical protein